MTVEKEIPVFAHTQVPLLTPWDYTASVDEGLAPLLALLWKNGLQTQYSCEGGLEPGTVSEAGGQAQPSQFTIHTFFTGALPGLSDAHIIFTDYLAGLDFMQRSIARLHALRDDTLDDGDFPDPDTWYAGQMSMKVYPPIDDGKVYRADVLWLYTLTPKLIEVWS